MLIVGTAVENYGKPDIDTNLVSILVSNNNIEKLHKILNTERTTFVSISPHAEIYRQKGSKKKRFLIMRAGDNIYLEKFIVKGQAISELRMATPAINYAFFISLPNIRHNNSGEWLSRVYASKYGRIEFEKVYKNPKERSSLIMYGKKIIDYFSQMEGLKKSWHRPADFEIYDKYEILKHTSCEQEFNSTFLKSYGKLTIKTKDNYYIQYVFISFTQQNKINSMIDKCILDAINEDFMSELWIYNRFPPANKWFNLYLTAIMNTATNGEDENYFMKEFVLDNIADIVAGYDKMFFQNFITAHHSKLMNAKLII